MPSTRARLLALVALFLAAVRAGALPVETRKGVVASAHPAASRVGAEVLASGGNAVDAVVATAFALAVVEPHSSGLGGGGFALLYDAKTGAITAVDFREVAPAAATPALFEKNGIYEPTLSREGGRSVAVPGAVAGYADLARRFGTKPLDVLTAGAATLAESGVILGAGDRRALEHGEKPLNHFPVAAKAFGLHTDVLGTTRRQPELAVLLKAIGKEGPSAFYSGRSAEAIVLATSATGGVLTVEDLAHYTVRDVKPLEGSFRGHRVVTMPPPSAGGFTVLATLQGLERLKAEKPDARPHDLVELWNRAYAARAADLGDPRAEPAVTPLVERLLTPATMDRWARSIGGKAVPASKISAEIAEVHEGIDTTHISVIDAAGNIALMTTTINGTFGSGVLVPEIGVLLNNEMDDFAPTRGGNLYGLVGGRYNAVAPGKTPVSTMAPTIVFDGTRPWILVGTPGGSTIATSIVQVILHIMDDGMDVQQAVSEPRFHSQFQPDEVRFEPAVHPGVLDGLRKRGHKVLPAPFRFGNVQAITINADGLRSAASDPRGVGSPVAEDQLERRR